MLGSVPTMVLFHPAGGRLRASGAASAGPCAGGAAGADHRRGGAGARRRSAAAEAKTAEYEDKLRQAKAEIFAAREQQAEAVERGARAGPGRGARRDRWRRCARRRLEIEQSVAVARQQIEGMSAELSEQILRAVMPAGTRPEAAQ